MSESVPACENNRVRTVLRIFGHEARQVVAGLFDGLGYLSRRRVRRPQPWIGFPAAWELLAFVAVALGLIAGSMLLVDPLVHGLRLHLPEWVVILSERLTDVGLGTVVLWPLGLALIYVLALRPRLDSLGQRVASAVYARLGFLFLAIAPVGLGVAVFKHLLGRARPYMALHLPGPNSQLSFEALGWNASFASFPSGHSTTIFAAAVALGALFPKARWPLVGLAVVVATTRVLLNSHYPSDVLAGAFVATLYVLWLVRFFAARRVVFTVDDSSHAVPMAGPSARWLGRLLPGVARSSHIPPEEAKP
ncbi:phosphatase PAP2 family protein [Xanthobacter sp. TB0139]|uniref:phosphatase PAP2 family protein n=1 Tax=Xanthobacter sp. TB0139 TaxID=3459178 RepID=UPI0040392C83